MLLFLAESVDEARVDAVGLELSGYEIAGAHPRSAGPFAERQAQRCSRLTCDLSTRDLPLTKYLFQIIVGATSDTRSAFMDVDQLLTTTRLARKALDLHAPIHVGVITFRAASRRPIAEVVAVDTWEGQPL
jgi:hypothetical protein